MDLKNLLNTNDSLEETRKAKMESQENPNYPSKTTMTGPTYGDYEAPPSINRPPRPHYPTDQSRPAEWRAPNGGGIKASDQSRNGHSMDDIKPTRFLEDLSASSEPQIALRIIDRFRKGELRTDIDEDEGGTELALDEKETPQLVGMEAYDDITLPNWNAQIWKPDQLEPILGEFSTCELKSGHVTKRSLRDFRRHADNSPEEILIARTVPVMHLPSCRNSPKGRHCLGCSPQWLFAQKIQSDLRPWGSDDLLLYDPDLSHSFFHVEVAMHGAYVPPLENPLPCDSFHTLAYSDDPEGAVLWGFMGGEERQRLKEEAKEELGFTSPLWDASLLPSQYPVKYAVQRIGQTIVVPASWTAWRVYCGRGIHVSNNWEGLRMKHLTSARQKVEYNRTVGISRPLNLSSLVIYAAFQKIDELDTATTPREKHQICQLLSGLLPVLRTAVLEDLLGEHINLSGAVVLGYDQIVNQLATSIRKGLSQLLAEELFRVRGTPLPSADPEGWEDDVEGPLFCAACKYLLFNHRRSCHSCQAFHLCESCWVAHGKLHSHPMKKHRKVSVQTLVDLVERIRVALNDHEHEEPPPPEIRNPSNSKKRERREMSNKGEEEEGSQNNYDEEVIDCICGNNKDLGFMISCEKCYTWLHGKCVGISKRNEPEVYYCPRCVKKTTPTLINAKLSPKNFSPEERLKEYNLL